MRSSDVLSGTANAISLNRSRIPFAHRHRSPLPLPTGSQPILKGTPLSVTDTESTAMTLQMLSLDLIVVDKRVQARVGTDAKVVDEYADAMRNGVKFPPLIVFYDGNVYRLGDGFHRYAAAPHARYTEFWCEVRPGGLREATLFAVGANASHGRPRSNEDKRAAVQKLLMDDEWSDWSDREIARCCHVSHQLVADLRDLTGRETSERKYQNKYGDVGTMSTDKIGKGGKGQDNAMQQPVPAVVNQTAAPSPPVAAVQPSPEVPQPVPAGDEPEVSSASTQVDRGPDVAQTELMGPLTEKQANAERQAAIKMEFDRATARDEDIIQDIAKLIFEAPRRKRSLLIEKLDEVGLGVTVADLVDLMKEMRPKLFRWED